METIESILEPSHIIIFLFVFMSLVIASMLWSKIEARKLREETDKLIKLVEKLEQGKNVSDHANQE